MANNVVVQTAEPDLWDRLRTTDLQVQVDGLDRTELWVYNRLTANEKLDFLKNEADRPRMIQRERGIEAAKRGKKVGGGNGGNAQNAQPAQKQGNQQNAQPQAQAKPQQNAQPQAQGNGQMADAQVLKGGMYTYEKQGDGTLDLTFYNVTRIYKVQWDATQNKWMVTRPINGTNGQFVTMWIDDAEMPKYRTALNTPKQRKGKGGTATIGQRLDATLARINTAIDNALNGMIVNRARLIWVAIMGGGAIWAVTALVARY